MISNRVLAPCNEKFVTLEDHVRDSEVFKQKSSFITFDYQLNDTATQSKI